MPMLYRLWTKIRRPEIREWDIAHTGPWDAAIRGSSALRAAVLGAMFDEVATLNGEAVSTILWDMEKFYDNIQMNKLIAKAIEVEYPLTVFCLGLQMHMAPRALKTYDCNAYAQIPCNGIIAGCVQSNYLARVLLFTVMQELWNENIHPSKSYLRTVVDDIRQSECGDVEQVARSTVHKAKFLADRLGKDGLGCVISKKHPLGLKLNFGEEYQRIPQD